jgi:hypothetical protein
MAGRVVLFVTRADDVALRMAGSCALAATAMNGRVDVFVFGPAVAALVERFGDPEHPSALLQQARGLGACRLLGCSAGLVDAKVDLSLADAALDAVVGWPTVLEWSRGVVDRFYF